MEKVLDENVGDCFSYLQYIGAKNQAEEAQVKYDEKMRNAKHKK